MFFEHNKLFPEFFAYVVANRENEHMSNVH